MTTEHSRQEDARLQRSRVFCIAPWTHVHVLPTGQVFPCCMSAHDAGNEIGDLRSGDTLESAWNAAPMKALRLRMLHDERSSLCERCYAMEGVGQESWRQTENRLMASHYSVVESTAGDGSVRELHLPYLDIRYSNICNLKCRICTPKLSSSWHADAVKLGYASRSEPAIMRATADPSVLMDQVLPLLPKVERVHFGGGEPLLSEEHYQVLETLLALGRTDVRLTYNTNLSRMKLGQRDVIALWKQFRRVYVQASLDGMGARGDYMRSGQRWPQIVENRSRMLEDCPHVEFSVLATVSIMNVLHLPDFYHDWVERKLIQPSEFQLNLLTEPAFFCIRGLPSVLKDRVERRYCDLADEFRRLPGTDRMRSDCRAMIEFMRAEDWDIDHALQQHTADLDAVRNESFVSVFPELAELSVDAAERLLFAARAHYKIGKLDRAEADLNDAIVLIGQRDATPQSRESRHVLMREAYTLRGRTLRALGFPERADRDISIAVQIDGALGMQLGSDPVPSISLPTIARMTPNGGWRNVSHFQDGQHQRMQGDVRAALESFARAVTAAPVEALTQLNLRLAETRQGIELIPSEGIDDAVIFGNPAFGHYLRAVAKRALGDHQGAQDDLDSILALRPLLMAAQNAAGANSTAASEPTD